MANETVQRKLAAILSADVQGYSRLMGEDELSTILTLTAYRGVIGRCVNAQRGRVVDTPGDNVLAEFASVVDAVACAVEIQKALREENAQLPPNRRMEFRIGINLGDVVVEGERIYGDGVNTAARLEALADGGGICIAGTVYDQVESKLPLAFEYLGEQAVKNIAKRVRAYRVMLNLREPEVGGVAAAAALLPERASLPEVSDKPSIAVLPFLNMSGDPEQEYFSDGITEDLITDLSKISGLFVIARNSAFAYKGKAPRIGEVGRELGVRYVLEGSVRKANGRVRVNAQLIDVTTGGHIWAERYDRDLEDIFAVQDDVTHRIVSTLAVKLTQGERQRLGCKCTDHPEAYDYYLRGLDSFRKVTREATLDARRMYEKAVDLDPAFAEAYAGIGWTYLRDWTFQLGDDPQTLDRAYEQARRAVSLDPSLPVGRMLLAHVHVWRKEFDEAIAQAEEALGLHPNDADAHAGMAQVLNWVGRPQEAIEMVEKAMRLNPRYPALYLMTLGQAYYLAGRYDDAVAALLRSLIRNPDWLPARAYLAAAYFEQGRLEEARAEMAQVIALNPDVSLEVLQDRLPHRDPADRDRVLAAWRSAAQQ